MASADAIAGVVSYLRTVTEITDLVGTRVFAAELPAAEVASMPRQCVVIRASGGAPQKGTLRMRKQRVDVFAYGATPQAAKAASDVAYTALHQMRRNTSGSNLLLEAEPELEAIQTRDPDTEWPYAFHSWSVTAAECVPS